MNGHSRLKPFAVVVLTILFASTLMVITVNEESDAGYQVVENIRPQIDRTAGPYAVTSFNRDTGINTSVGTNDDGHNSTITVYVYQVGWLSNQFISLRVNSFSSTYINLTVVDLDTANESRCWKFVSSGDITRLSVGSSISMNIASTDWRNVIELAPVGDDDIYYAYFNLEMVTSSVYNTTARITFDPNGGVGEPEPLELVLTNQTSTSGRVTLDIPDVEPTRDGYEFVGWESPAHNMFYPGGTVTVDKTAEIVFLAVWKASGFTITFDSNGSSTIPSQIIDPGGYAVAPDAPALEGYTFTGWFLDDGTFLDEFDFTEPITSSITLYARWDGNLQFTTDPISDGHIEAIDGLPGTVSFSASPSSYYASVLWDFGDGTSSTNLYATHYYGQPGVYHATLTVFNNHGSDTTEFIIEVPEMASGGGGNDLLLWVAVGLLLILTGGLVVRRLL